MNVIFRNTILKALTPEIIDRLHLHPVTFELNHEIEFPGKTVHHLFFVEAGMASQTVTFADGFEVEVSMFGFESVIGISALMGSRQSLNRVYTQIQGHGYSCTLDRALDEFKRGDIFHSLALRYVQAQLVQCMQSAACNAKHKIEQRLARWLLICADRAHTNKFAMPHEFLAHMIGNTRPSVSTAAALLKKAGVIHYTRGVIEILDPAALEAISCECYRVIKNHLDQYDEFAGSVSPQ